MAKALAYRSTLLVLDNCEHLVADVARVAHAALDAAAGLRVLATSQEALKTPGEYVYRLDSLAVPPPGTSLECARTFGAIQLLEQRARAVDRLFALSESTIAGAIELCRHLDGIALAIEMAAVRLPLLGLEALQARLGERLKLLRGASRLMPARHQTLRATLDWSHSLLNSEEQAVLRRLSVFAGSFRLDMAQRVAATEDLDEWMVLDALTALIDKSLVQVERNEPPRYRLLETTRLYAAERLLEHAETEATLRRHSEALAALADESNQGLLDAPRQAVARPLCGGLRRPAGRLRSRLPGAASRRRGFDRRARCSTWTERADSFRRCATGRDPRTLCCRWAMRLRRRACGIALPVFLPARPSCLWC